MNRQNPVNMCLDLVFGKQVSGYGIGKQVSDFLGEKTGVRKQVVGYGSRKQVSGNR